MPVRSWEKVASQPRPSWYLDPLVAQQKRQVHLDLLQRWAPPEPPRVLLKTDLFEEAYGADSFLRDLYPDCLLRLGLDVSPATAGAAALGGRPSLSAVAADVRRLPLASGSVDLIISNSTLDHFDTRGDIDTALHELARVLRPGGTLVVTFDNPWNLLYWPLRWWSRGRRAPFPLGCTLSIRQLRRALLSLGLEVLDTATLIHNPRLISTALFLALRRFRGPRAESSIAALLRVFGGAEHLPTRWLTSCFVAAAAKKISPTKAGSIY